MAGLLDTQNINPLALGLLGAGGAIMSGRRGLAQAPQAFAGGLMQGQQMQQAQRAAALREQMAAQQMDMQRQQLGLQQGRYGMEQEKFAAEQAAAAAKAADVAKMREFQEKFIAEAERTDPGLARLARVDLKAAIERAAPKPEWRTWFDAATGQQTQGYVAPGMAPQVVGGAERKFVAVDDGQNIRYVEPNVQAGAGPIPRQLTPEAQQAARDAAAGRGVTMRGQDMTDVRARETGGRPEYDPERGAWVYRPTAAAPNGAMIPAVGPDGNPVPPKVDANTLKEVSGIDAELRTIQEAARSAKATPSAFSLPRGLATLTGPVTESVAGRLDSPQERQTRAFVYNVVSKSINERAGAAQTVQEMSRLRSFLPAETDNAEQVIDKLNGYEQYLRERRAAYERPGVRPAPGDQPGPRVDKQPNTFSMLPNAREHDGKTARDTVSGKSYKSQGGKWVEVQP